MFLGIDALYLIMMIPVFLFSLWASFSVKSRFKKYSEIGIRSGMTGAKAAMYILQVNGLSDVRVERSSGFLSDHYDPREKVVRLSEEVYDGSSISSVGVAAHETGHALQHAHKYSPLILRNTIAPTASIGSNLSYVIIFLGLILASTGLLKFGIVLFTIVVVFQIITLPVEFNASTRAKKILISNNIIQGDEAEGVSNVLNAAAMTYVAAAASSIVTLIYYLIQLGVLGGRDD